jgi:hypothetical protein
MKEKLIFKSISGNILEYENKNSSYYNYMNFKEVTP